MTLVFALMHYIVFLICNFFVHSVLYFIKSGIEMPDWNGQWYQHLLTLFAIFYKSSTEGTDFQIMFKYVLLLSNVYVLCIVFNFCKIWISEKAWGDPVRLTGL